MEHVSQAHVAPRRPFDHVEHVSRLHERHTAGHVEHVSQAHVASGVPFDPRGAREPGPREPQSGARGAREPDHADKRGAVM